MPVLRNLVFNTSAKLGKFLSNISHVLLTLLIYVVLSVLTYIWLLFQLAPQGGKAGFIAYEIATGSDPYNFAGDVQQFFLLWHWILIFHIISWLLVPILAATAVDATFRIHEERRRNLHERLFATMEKIIRNYGGIPEDKAESFAIEAREAMELEIRKKK